MPEVTTDNRGHPGDCRFSAMRSLEELIDATAQAEGFSGVVRLDRRGRTEVSNAYG